MTFAYKIYPIAEVRCVSDGEGPAQWRGSASPNLLAGRTDPPAGGEAWTAAHPKSGLAGFSVDALKK
jgi:hypothetical protein